METLKRGGWQRQVKIGGCIAFLIALLAAFSGCGPFNHPPVAVITAHPTSGQAPLEVSFDASQSYDPDGRIISYAWKFGDGSSGSGVTATHTYNSQGTYVARLTVTDNEEATGSASVTIGEQEQIGTYNLDFFTDLDPSTGAWCEEHTHHTEANIKALASFIDSLDIEVLALQEVEDAAALDKLLAYMPPNKYRYIISRQKDQSQRVAVLYQPQKVSVTYRGEIPLNPPGHTKLRNGLVVDGKVLPDGFDFTLVVVHLKAYPDYKSRMVREQQLKLLGDWVTNYLNDPNNDPDIILAGDFNDPLLTDTQAFSLLDERSHLRILTQDAPDKVCTPDGRYYTDPIDHIIISPNAQNEYEGTTTLDNYFTDSTLPYRESYSDHCVLWSDFSSSDLDGVVQAPPTTTGKGTAIASTAHVVINEVELNPQGWDAGNEWVELYNPSNNDIHIGGWTLRTTHGRTVTLWIPQGTVIKAHGYSVWSYPKQWLDNKDEMVILSDSSGSEIDRTPLLRDTHNDNWDWQRCPNGHDTDSFSDWRFEPSTLGKSNNC